MNALALIVGNADYSLDKDKLVNAVNDAKDVSKKLLNLGFVTKSEYDCTGQKFNEIIREFGNELFNYDVGLFYFSGHGLQIEGKNYLTAIDTSFEDDSSAKYTSIQLDLVIEYMQKANPKIKILILDACRDNPLPSFYRSIQGNHLAPIHAPKGTIIAFSTSPGEKALDHGAGRNSIYTGSFLNHIDDPNIPIEEFFKRVRTSVFTLSNGKQTSWEHSSLIGDFSFNSKQLIHSINLPYKDEHIADENFVSDGSEIENEIFRLKSHDYYQQNPALQKLKAADASKFDISQSFLFGRNILQSAIGGEGLALSYFDTLVSSLQKYSKEDGTNHVLNGILFEIYFNAKGQFRQLNFKSGLIDKIFELQDNDGFKLSFEFIQKQLAPFSKFLVYLPTVPSKSLPIEIKFEEYDDSFVDKITKAHRVISIKYSEEELMTPYSEDVWMRSSISFLELQNQISQKLCVPLSKLRLSMNVNKENLKRITVPFPFNLSRDAK